MSLPIINKESSDYAKEKLSKFYENSFIPAEKKSYIADLDHSSGPYLAIENKDGLPTYILDCASQIASLGLGFNPTSFFGVNHFLESYTNNPNAPEFRKLLKSYKSFLKRKLDTEELGIDFTSSGAESIETALGMSYNNRTNPKRQKVLAFEGSFHGRMLVSLASTWNKSKREPFVFPGFETTFLTAPNISDDNIDREFPKNWIKTFENAHLSNSLQKDFKSKDNEQLQKEIKVLKDVKAAFLSNEVFALIIEPMQCEGGDKYFSSRFINALVALSKAFDVPLIFDEVQTGFHLGTDFFWHRSFDIRNSKDQRVFPDYVVCAKKSQSGMVLSFKEKSFPEKLQEVNTASIIRGYYHALALDQSKKRIKLLETKAKNKLNKLISVFSEYIHSPRVSGLAFAFDLKDSDLISKFIQKRFDHGLLFYPAGSHTLRFRLNTSFTDKDLDFLFESLIQLSLEIFKGKPSDHPVLFNFDNSRLKRLFDFQSLILSYKAKILRHVEVCSDETLEEINKYFLKYSVYKLIIIDKNNFKKYKQKIVDLEELVYEPTRQTSIKNFETCVESTHGLAIGLVSKKDELQGISFCSSLSDHPLERGVRRDDNYNNPYSVYMLDTTVHPSINGKGFGRDLKYALSTLLLVKGYYSISGRNRDQMASSMLSINSSLGAYKTQFIKEDYPDFEEHRDVIYYSHKLSWEKENLSLSSRTTSPLSNYRPTSEFVKKNISIMNNKLCLSNFVTSDFLDNLKSIGQNMPSSLKHIYTTSGQSECVDKIIKSIWYKREGLHCSKLLSFKGHYFGQGSFLSRDLGQKHSATYFKTKILDHPTNDNLKVVIGEVEKELKTKEILSIWIEPLLQKSMKEVPPLFLKELITLANSYQVPVVFNETASSNFRYNAESEFCSGLEGLTPTASMLYLGGQSGICFLHKDYFLETPLMVISTWDGDEVSFNNYQFSREEIQRSNHKEIYLDFEKKLKELLSLFLVKELVIKNARGSFSGDIPLWLQELFIKNDDKYIINPGHYSIVEFCKKQHEIINSLKELK